MNPRMRRFVEECQESYRFARFVRDCQMEGLGSAEAEDDRFFSPEQQIFFGQYEREMFPLLYALEDVVAAEG